MLGATSALAFLMAMAFPQDPASQAPSVQAPISYEAAASGDWGEVPESATAETADFTHGDPRWSARVTLYHHGGGGATGNDSLGCRPVPYRTIAVDPRQITRRTRVFIPETVGIRLPNGQTHDGYWYATDTGGAIKGSKVDFYTGHGRGSMQPVMRLNTRTVSMADAGRFDGCPPSWEALPSREMQMASLNTTTSGSR